MKKNQTNDLTPVPGAEGGLFLLEGQYVFKWIDGGGEHIKILSPASVRAAFAKEPIDSGWLPNLNRWGSGSKGTWMVRWHEPAVYKFTVDLGEKGKRALRVPMPSLIWFGQKTHYYIFAAKEKAFSPKAALYRAPLPNVNNIGLICFGSNRHPDVERGGFEATWKTFWEAPFSDHQDDGKSVSERKEILKKLTELHRSKAAQYPLKDLVRASATLESAIAKLTRRDADAIYFDGGAYGEDEFD